MTTFRTGSAIGCPSEVKIMPGGGKNYGHGMPIDESVFLSYFTPEGSRCSTCGASVDLWTQVQEVLTGFERPNRGGSNEPKSKPLMFTSMALGLPGTSFVTELRPKIASEVRFEDHGIPLAAKIISVNYNIEGPGDLWPTQMLPQRISGESIPHHTVLFPWLRPGGKEEATIVRVWVLWVDDSFVAPSFIHIVEALLHYTHNEFDKCVRSAQLAIEEPFKDLVRRAFDAKGVLPNTVHRLLKSRRHREVVEELLPSVAEDLGLCPMPAQLIKGIKMLAGLRNPSSHQASATVPEPEARDGLLSALFGLYYALYFDSLLKTT